MADSSTFTAGVADRYATALFELALESGDIEAVERDVEALSAALNESADLRTLVESPLYSRDTQGKAMASVADAMGLGKLATNILGVMAGKRRLFVLDDTLALFRRRLADHRGEVTAEVTAARAMTDAQREALAETLKGATGRDVKLDIKVDESLIGGLVVKLGSKMIDTSIRSKLNSLRTTMREAG